MTPSSSSVLPGKSFAYTCGFSGKAWALTPAIFRIISPKCSANSVERAVIFLCTTKTIIITKKFHHQSRMQKNTLRTLDPTYRSVRAGAGRGASATVSWLADHSRGLGSSFWARSLPACKRWHQPGRAPQIPTQPCRKAPSTWEWEGVIAYVSSFQTDTWNKTSKLSHFAVQQKPNTKATILQ